jgi:hypothetical protein
MLVGLKSFVISRTTGLYGLKFAKLSASADDFLTLFHIIGRFCYSDTRRYTRRNCAKRLRHEGVGGEDTRDDHGA